MEPTAFLRFAVAGLLLCWLPGALWVSWLVPDPLTRIERGVLSVAISIAGVTLVYFLLVTVAGVPVTPGITILVGLFLCAVPGGILAFNRWDAAVRASTARPR